MTPGPGDRLTPSTAGRGHLRASHDDREHVVDFLKAAFVQGRLTKEELEARAGQALGSRTYAELAGLTGDLPGGPVTAAPPRQAARSRARRLPMGKVALVSAGVLGPPSILVAAMITGNEELAKVFALIFPFYFLGWVAAVWQILDNLWQRPRGQLPAGPAQRASALEGEQGARTDNDPMLAEARDNGRADRGPGRQGVRCARRSPPVHQARRVPADLRCTA
jgi:hypothetical protein